MRLGGGVAGGADLRAELEALEPVEVLHLRRRRGLHRDDGLGDVEVGRREVDGLLAFVGDGELIEVGVERLWARRDGRVERHPHPLHVLLGVAELVGDGVGDRGLEALAVGGVVVDEPRRVRRLIGAEGDGPLGQRGQGVLGARLGAGSGTRDDVLSAGAQAVAATRPTTASTDTRQETLRMGGIIAARAFGANIRITMFGATCREGLRAPRVPPPDWAADRRRRTPRSDGAPPPTPVPRLPRCSPPRAE